ncbi:unnamed protein product, partial [Prorocentrum cordatum]
MASAAAARSRPPDAPGAAGSLALRGEAVPSSRPWRRPKGSPRAARSAGGLLPAAAPAGGRALHVLPHLSGSRLHTCGRHGPRQDGPGA